MLAGEDGKMLVRARYAVRNNQRAFLALKLPAQSVLWSAVLAGRPIRPGVSADGGVPAAAAQGTGRRDRADLRRRARLPAARRRRGPKGRGARRVAGGRSPGLAHGTGRPLTRRASRSSPSLARSGSKPAGALERGARRRCGDRRRAVGAAEAPAREPAVAGQSCRPAPPPPPAERRSPSIARRSAPRRLSIAFGKEMGRTTAGAIPVHVTVPEIGPSFFVVAELTPELHSAGARHPLQAHERQVRCDMTEPTATDRPPRHRCCRACSPSRPAGRPGSRAGRHGHAVAHRLRSAARSRQPPASPA